MLEMPDSEEEIPPDVPEVTGHVPKKGADCALHLTPSAPMPEVLAQDETIPGTPLHLTPSAPMPEVLAQDETIPGTPLHLTPSAPMPEVLAQDETFPGIPPPPPLVASLDPVPEPEGETLPGYSVETTFTGTFEFEQFIYSMKTAKYSLFLKM